jgi:hypothetical protein
MTRTKRLGGRLSAAMSVLAFAAALSSQPALADQQHAFDFHFGTWRTHILSRVSATKWMQMTGTVIDQPLWGGKANLEKIEASGSDGHFQGVTLFLYSPKSGQWSQTFASSSDGIMQESAYGEFKNGRGVFYAQSRGSADKAVFERETWSDITPMSYHFEIATSDDGGKTWVAEFIARLTRLRQKPDYDTAYTPGSGPEHDYDFNIGRWKTQIRAVENPIAAPGVWTNLQGEHVVYRVWGDWANIGQLEVDGPGGPDEFMALRMYDRKTRQWRVYFANSSSGTLDQPMVGQFNDGVGTFVFLDDMGGKTVLVRNVWSGITTRSCHQDWAISADGGKTWVPTWISTDTRGD